jgi:hypothetical protein
MRELTAAERDNIKAISFQLLYEKETPHNTFFKNKTEVIDTAYYNFPNLTDYDCEEKVFHYSSKTRIEGLIIAALFASILILVLKSLLFPFGKITTSGIYVSFLFLALFGAGLFFLLRHALSKRKIVISNKGKTNQKPIN